MCGGVPRNEALSIQAAACVGVVVIAPPQVPSRTQPASENSKRVTGQQGSPRRHPRRRRYCALQKQTHGARNPRFAIIPPSCARQTPSATISQPSPSALG